MRKFRVYGACGYPLKSSIFSAHFCARNHHGAPGGPAHARFATRRRVHAEARVGHARRGKSARVFCLCPLFVRGNKSASFLSSSLNWKCLNVRACIEVLTPKLFSSSLLFSFSLRNTRAIGSRATRTRLVTS